MNLFQSENTEYQEFYEKINNLLKTMEGHASEEEIKNIHAIEDNFKMKVNDFYRENRKLNIGVVGQVKAGKSSFLNTLLFDGKEVLPKASTPKNGNFNEDGILRRKYYPDRILFERRMGSVRRKCTGRYR